MTPVFFSCHVSDSVHKDIRRQLRDYGISQSSAALPTEPRLLPLEHRLESKGRCAQAETPETPSFSTQKNIAVALEKKTQNAK